MTDRLLTGVGPSPDSTGVVDFDNLLLENSDDFLLENDSQVLLESA